MTVIFGGTFAPPHLGHVECVAQIKRAGHSVIVVPSAGHEGKPESLATYRRRLVLSELAFGKDMWPIESLLDPNDPRRALLVLRQARRMFGEDLAFGIGPDINPKSWTGYEEIISEGFSFYQLPDTGHARSSEIRARIADGREWTHLVPPAVAARIMMDWTGQLFEKSP